MDACGMVRDIAGEVAGDLRQDFDQEDDSSLCRVDHLSLESKQ